MIEVLAFLYENFLQTQLDIQKHMDQIAKELPGVGFKSDEISGAMDWLHKTFENKMFDSEDLQESKSIRPFTTLEMAKLDVEARGLIYFLHSQGMIGNALRELLVERAMALNVHAVGKDQMKWVFLFVMMNNHAKQDIFHWIEQKIIDFEKSVTKQ